MNNLILQDEDLGSEGMTSITIDVDTHETNQSISSNSLNEPLKSILKKSSDYSEENRLVELSIKKLCCVTLLLLINIPIIFCDMYYGLTDKRCVNEKPPYLNVSLKIYLLLSGAINLGLLFVLIFALVYVKNFGDKNDIAYLMLVGNIYVSGIFNLMWNIIGSVVYWGYIYDNKTCEITMSTYIFISLIIKLIGCALFIFYKNK